MNKDVWDDIGRAVTGAADTVSRKSKEIAEVTRLKNQIYSQEREIKRDYMAIGKMLYEKFVQEGNVEEPYLTFCESIARREILIDQYEGEVEELKKAF